MRHIIISLIYCLAVCISYAEEPVYHQGSTRVVCQITGDEDTHLLKHTLSRTATQAGVLATDLGSSFGHKDLLFFLFGDTIGRTEKNVDCFAVSDSNDPQNLVIKFPHSVDKKFLPIKIAEISQGAMAVPSYGVWASGKIYIVHTTNWYHPENKTDPKGNMERSILACSSDNGRTWNYLYDLSAAKNHDMTAAKFINVSMANIKAKDFKGFLPYDSGQVILVWGSGAYRKSNPSLACIPADKMEDKTALRFFSGFDKDGKPAWSKKESDAVPLFDDPRLGELSTAWIDKVSRWVILYNTDTPPGVCMRTAEKPWGPYSQPQFIFDSSLVHENRWAGAYGPYIIPRFTSGNNKKCIIYYTLSAWRPYQTFLVRSEIGEPIPKPAETVTDYIIPGDDSWKKSSIDFFKSFIHNDTPYITTFGSAGDASKGIMWQYLPRDQKNTTLNFSVHGGHADVMLIEGSGDIPVDQADLTMLYKQIRQGKYGTVVRSTRGKDNNNEDISANWDLMSLDSANLKIVIIDHLNELWGFVSVSKVTLLRSE
jgi:hypothetical protein